MKKILIRYTLFLCESDCNNDFDSKNIYLSQIVYFLEFF